MSDSDSLFDQIFGWAGQLYSDQIEGLIYALDISGMADAESWIKFVEEKITAGHFVDFIQNRLALACLRLLDDSDKSTWCKTAVDPVINSLFPEKKSLEKWETPLLQQCFFAGWVLELLSSLCGFLHRKSMRGSIEIKYNLFSNFRTIETKVAEFGHCERLAFNKGKAQCLDRFVTPDGRFRVQDNHAESCFWLFVFSDAVDSMESTTEVHNFLEFIQEAPADGIERTRQLCQRIGLKLRGRGAPAQGRDN